MPPKRKAPAVDNKQPAITKFFTQQARQPQNVPSTQEANGLAAPPPPPPAAANQAAVPNVPRPGVRDPLRKQRQNLQGSQLLAYDINISQNTERQRNAQTNPPQPTASLADVLSGLNDEQKDAVTSSATKPLLVLAGAGTGKTTALIARIQFLIAHENVPASRILAITFTNKAAKELRDRLESKGLPVEQLEATTFHSYCFKVLRYHHKAVGFERRPNVWASDRELKPAVVYAMRLADLALGLMDVLKWLNLPTTHEPPWTWARVMALVQEREPELHSQCKEGAEKAVEKARKRKGGGKKRKQPEGQEASSGRQKQGTSSGKQKAGVAPKGAESAQQPDVRPEDALLMQLEMVAALYKRLADTFLPDNQSTIGAKPKVKEVKQMQKWLDTVKRSGREPEEFEPRHRQIYKSYQAYLRRCNAMDFNDLLLLTAWLLGEHPNILRAQQARYTHLLVDEYQDCNDQQRRIVDLLQGERGQVTAVGDDCQSIYGFRGAQPNVFPQFIDTYSGGGLQQRALQRNYRSRPPILRVANDVLDGTKVLKKVLQPTKPDDNVPVRLWELGTPQQEAEEVANEIVRLHTDEDRPYGSFAILLRSFRQGNAKSHNLFQKEFRSRRIPFTIVRDISLFERVEVLDILAYLRLALNPDDNAAFKRVMNKPPRRLGGAVEKLLDEYIDGATLSILQPDSQTAADPKRPTIMAVTMHEAARKLLSEGRLKPGQQSALQGLMDLLKQLRMALMRLTPAEAVEAVLRDTGYLEFLKKQRERKDKGAAPTVAESDSSSVVSDPSTDTLSGAGAGSGASSDSSTPMVELSEDDSTEDVSSAPGKRQRTEEAVAGQGKMGPPQGGPSAFTTASALLRTASQPAAPDHTDGGSTLSHARSWPMAPPKPHNAAGRGPSGSAGAPPARPASSVGLPPRPASSAGLPPRPAHSGQSHRSASKGSAAAGAAQSGGKKGSAAPKPPPLTIALKALMDEAQSFTTQWQPRGVPSCETPAANAGADAQFSVPTLFKLSRDASLAAFQPDQLVAAGIPQQVLDLLYGSMKAGPLPLEEFLGHVALASKEEKDEGGRKGVIISTIHAAKGLEYGTVFVPHWVQGFLPAMFQEPQDDYSADQPSETQKAEMIQVCEEQHREEECRLAHVAVTRAKERLYICTLRYRGFRGLQKADPSPFKLPQDPAVIEKRVFPVMPDELMAAAEAEAQERSQNRAMGMLRRP